MNYLWKKKTGNLKIQSENQKIGEEIYDDLLSAVQDSLQGIVCWGDESMVGNRSGSLSEMLDDVIDAALFDQFKKDLAHKARLYKNRELNVNVINMGASNEGFNEILTRTGAHQLVLGDEYTILSDKDARENITLADPAGNVMLFAEQKYALFGETTIEGITGRLYDGTGYYDPTHMKISFGRDYGGSAITVPAGTAVYTEGAEK